MNVKRKIIEIDEQLCDGCGQCVTACAEGAIAIINGKAKVLSDRFCDGLGACIGECPQGALKIVERDAEEFDEEAVSEHLQQISSEKTDDDGTCQLAHIHQSAQNNSAADQPGEESSQLLNWPVQIRLVQPTAPFLENADLLIASDCAAVACPHFHRDFLKGRVVLMGCPKFDYRALYDERFFEIFSSTPIKSVTIAVMEVPCCQSMPIVVKTAIEKAGKKIPCETVILNARGHVLKRVKNAA